MEPVRLKCRVDTRWIVMGRRYPTLGRWGVTGSSVLVLDPLVRGFVIAVLERPWVFPYDESGFFNDRLDASAEFPSGADGRHSRRHSR